MGHPELDFDPARLATALLVAVLMSLRGLSKRSLTRGGALAAFVVGFVTFATSYRFGLTLIAFYLSSSRLTKLGASLKKKIDAEYADGGARGAGQVLCCSALACVACVWHWARFGADEALDWDARPAASALQAAVLAHYACCNGDTWASEVGVLDPWRPRLVTSLLLRRVPRGTNGGMSFTGTAASVAGGAFIGAVFWAAGGAAQPGLVALGAAAGFVGSLVDSVLGATLQATWVDEDKGLVLRGWQRGATRVCGWDVLSNQTVNLLSVGVTMAWGAYVGGSFV